MSGDNVRIKVTRLNNRWHTRLYVNDKVRSEMACEYRADIGWACRQMLSWYQRLGGNSVFANAARRRQITTALIGKVEKIL